MRKQTTIEMQRLTVDEYREASKTPLIVVLDDVRSLHNVGSVFRTADTFRLEGVALCGITACPPAPEIHKTALGAEDSVPWTQYANAIECVNALHDEGYTVMAIEQCHGSVMLNNMSFDPERKYAVVLGNEVKGVHQEVIDLCDGCIEIPQLGTKHSMNVSVTAGIIIWEFARQITL